MFNDAIIVQTAVSAFNNAALYAPTFLWLGILMLPLFWMARVAGPDFVAHQTILPGLHRPATRADNYALVVLGTILGWLILMGGNYGVLRDAMSTLPYAMAGVMFFVTTLTVRQGRVVAPALPAWIANRVRRPRLMRYLVLLMVAVVAGAFGAPGWTGFLMAAASVLMGAMVGRAMPRGMNAMLGTVLAMMMVATLMLMQPEFFHFGQLGNLTLVHMGGLILLGAFAAATLALRYVHPRGRIHHSAYVKLKWMARLVSILAAALFVLTESVPVFLGLTGVIFLMCVMSVWHAERVPADLATRMWAMTMGIFGILTGMPVITVVGIILMASLPGASWRRGARFLI
ncbi:hypothetical protein HDR63_01560 [bacterium]|nr:hypothetical protein [bacterium]